MRRFILVACIAVSIVALAGDALDFPGTGRAIAGGTVSSLAILGALLCLWATRGQS